MKKIFEFNYTNDEYICTEASELGKRDYDFLDTKAQLRRINTLKIDSVQVSNTAIRLTSGEKTFVIRNFDKFYEMELYSLMPDVMKKIKKGISKFQRQKFSEKVVQNLKVPAEVVVASALLVSLLMGVNKGKNNTITPPIPESTSPIGIETDGDYDGLMDELDEDQLQTINTVDEAIKQEDEKTNTQSSIISDLEKETAHLDVQNMSDSEKAQYVNETYGETIEYYAEKWGLSSNLVTSMLTQESGGRETNLMQIQFYSWEEEPIMVYNFYENKYETFILTKDTSKKSTDKITYITPEDLKNPKTNISIGCVLFVKSAEMMDYHIGAAIQCYNFGYGNMKKVLNQTANQYGCTVEDLLIDQTNTDFIEFTNMIKEGDAEYLSHVIRYVDDDNSELSIRYLDENMDIQEVSISFSNQKSL